MTPEEVTRAVRLALHNAPRRTDEDLARAVSEVVAPEYHRLRQELARTQARLAEFEAASAAGRAPGVDALGRIDRLQIEVRRQWTGTPADHGYLTGLKHARDALLAALDCARTALKQDTDELDQPGRCGDQAPSMILPGGTEVPGDFCGRRHGHQGWHRAPDGAEWSGPLTGEGRTGSGPGKGAPNH